ncbi:MAG: hypothetical protein ACI9HB_002836, partial [Gammaproteobacteria bacterium]
MHPQRTATKSVMCEFEQGAAKGRFEIHRNLVPLNGHFHDAGCTAAKILLQLRGDAA